MQHAIRCIFQSINRKKMESCGLVLRHFVTYAVIELTVLAVGLRLRYDLRLPSIYLFASIPCKDELLVSTSGRELKISAHATFIKKQLFQSLTWVREDPESALVSEQPLL